MDGKKVDKNWLDAAIKEEHHAARDYYARSFKGIARDESRHARILTRVQKREEKKERPASRPRTRRSDSRPKSR